VRSDGNSIVCPNSDKSVCITTRYYLKKWGVFLTDYLVYPMEWLSNCLKIIWKGYGTVGERCLDG